MACEKDMKFQVQCPQKKFYWNTVTHIYLQVVCGCFQDTTETDRAACGAEHVDCPALRQSAPSWDGRDSGRSNISHGQFKPLALNQRGRRRAQGVTSVIPRERSHW